MSTLPFNIWNQEKYSFVFEATSLVTSQVFISNNYGQSIYEEGYNMSKFQLCRQHLWWSDQIYCFLAVVTRDGWVLLWYRVSEDVCSLQRRAGSGANWILIFKCVRSGEWRGERRGQAGDTLELERISQYLTASHSHNVSIFKMENLQGGPKKNCELHWEVI